MQDIKHMFASRTVWSNVIGLTAVTLSAFGYQVGETDADKVTDAILQVVAAASFIASTFFRVMATKRIDG
jgi:hypothetical protein